MEEFRSNLLLLLHCRYPQGMLLDKLEEEYERYFQKRVEPYMFVNEAPGSWRSVIEKTYLHNDLKVFEINSTLYVKPVGIRSETEMMLIAKLAKYSHFHYAQDSFFQLRDCTCCSQGQQQQIYSGFPSSALNHYSGTNSNALSAAAAVAAASNQYTANALQQQQAQGGGGGEQFRVQYVTTQGALQGATPLQATNLTATNLSMNGAVKYERFDDQTLRSPAGDYYIMLQGSQNQPIRYDTIGNLASPAIQTHGRQEVASTGVVYAAAPPQQTPPQQQQQQWNFNRSTDSAGSIVAHPQSSTTTPAAKPKGRGKGKKAANVDPLAATSGGPATGPGTGNKRAPKSKKSSGDVNSNKEEKQLHYCRWEGCKKSFRRYKLLENHERLAHLPAGDELTCTSIGCKLKFLDKKQLQHHESRCAMKPHRCNWESCDKTFRTSKLLHGHISAVHRKIGRNTYKCTIEGCTQAYPDASKLKTHEIRCRFRFDTLRDIDMENEANALAQQAQGASASVADIVGNTISSASNLTTSSISSGGGATNDDPMNMTMSSSIEENKPSTVDLSSFLKSEVGSEGQCFVTQNPI